MTLVRLNAPGLSALLALVCAALLLSQEHGRRVSIFDLFPLIALLPLAAVVGAAPHSELAWPALAVAIVVALLARANEDLLQSECAIKLLWVMGGALALGWAGIELLSFSTGTSEVVEQWSVLEMGLDPPYLWRTALPLTLLVGGVLLGGAPFHFWAADLFQGARPWLAPLSVAALQVSGAGWLMRRLEGIESSYGASHLTKTLLGIAALISLLVGAATLVFQRRPERRVGTLASLNGALLLATLASGHGGRGLHARLEDAFGLWAAHLVLALSAAGTLAHLVPVSSGTPESGSVLFRRHPWSGVFGLLGLFSLAGVPGTPGSRLWLGAARDLALAGQGWLLLALTAAWLAAFSVAVRQLHEAFGVSTSHAAPTRPVPVQARAVLWLAGGALLVVGLRQIVR